MPDHWTWEKRKQDRLILVQSWGNCLAQKMLGLRISVRSKQVRMKQDHLTLALRRQDRLIPVLKKQGNLRERNRDNCLGQMK
jgi:hypothetical protein